MKKFNLRDFKMRRVTIDELDDRMLLINLYATQALMFIIGMCWLIFQGRNPIALLGLPDGPNFLYWGVLLAAAALAVNLIAERWMPEEAADDGGVNERLFRSRPIWHILVIAATAALCEELLFRGAVQHHIGTYWTSILFAAIHVRYLKHWIPTGLVFLTSYGLGWILIETGTLWAPITAHFLIDAAGGLMIRFRRES
ncbi:MAG: abortive infection protein [Thermobacillus sp. ZCTH02-B1]|uniref:CPBP family intramembrane glutamic endopeptidase n=1 Tax=Thermobacillus sp. ZCTH02-B1 TaxID=1858795 RepID=UPI000B57260F|nr:CPBP family intramembrane glutamic endopeptidase [Thermobacillus sp. ZCTH02-B1]OUM96814.1 MAG: abortive infection protein [Thermobacillus sp. ZCTH02-B1]